MRLSRIIAVLAFFALPAQAAPVTYKVDSAHTTVSFKIRHLFSQVQGRFDKFEGTITFDPDAPASAKVEGSIETASINTNHAKRDAHLRNPDFFDVEKYPKISFRSTGVSDVDASKKTGKLNGVLSMHGVDKPVTLDVAFLGEGKDPWGNRRSGFTATTTLNRKDFGITWNETLESGGLLLGEEVQIEIQVEGLVPQ